MRCFPTLAISICASLLLPLSVYTAAVSVQEHATVLTVTALHCWQEEEFTMLSECSPCTAFQLKSWPPCHLTGFVEEINCSLSNRVEHKSCRSSSLEEKLFWRFEGVMLALTVACILLVIGRQRTMDRLASEKVRKQIEAI